MYTFSGRPASALFLALTLGASVALAHHGWSGYLDDDATEGVQRSGLVVLTELVECGTNSHPTFATVSELRLIA